MPSLLQQSSVEMKSTFRFRDAPLRIAGNPGTGESELACVVAPLRMSDSTGAVKAPALALLRNARRDTFLLFIHHPIQLLPATLSVRVLNCFDKAGGAYPTMNDGSLGETS